MLNDTLKHVPQSVMQAAAFLNKEANLALIGSKAAKKTLGDWFMVIKGAFAPVKDDNGHYVGQVVEFDEAFKGYETEIRESLHANEWKHLNGTFRNTWKQYKSNLRNLILEVVNPELYETATKGEKGEQSIGALAKWAANRNKTKGYKENPARKEADAVKDITAKLKEYEATPEELMQAAGIIAEAEAKLSALIAKVKARYDVQHAGDEDEDTETETKDEAPIMDAPPAAAVEETKPRTRRTRRAA